MDIEQHGYSEWLDSIEARLVGSTDGPDVRECPGCEDADNAPHALDCTRAPMECTCEPETRADGSPDLAWHRHTGERCMRAETIGDCPQNHRYGPTYERSI